MSWCRYVLLAGLLASGCGYQPLYGVQGAAGTGPQAQLETVRIEPIADRTGQQIYNFLRDGLNPLGRPASAQYLLSVVLHENEDTLFIREDQTASRANLTLRARFALRRADTGEAVLQGETRSTSSFDILTDPFATIVSEEDARRRSARELSDEIRTRLAIYFAKAGIS